VPQSFAGVYLPCRNGYVDERPWRNILMCPTINISNGFFPDLYVTLLHFQKKKKKNYNMKSSINELPLLGILW
jgi:hypothetical protein